MADAYAAYDVVRMAFDGTNDSTTITDALGHTFTAAGTSVLKTATQKYGTACAYFNAGATDPITSAYSTDWVMGSGDFCVDFFWKPHSSVTGILPMFTIQSDSTTRAMSVGLVTGGTNAFTGSVWIGTTEYKITMPVINGIGMLANWVHLAFFRYGTNIYLAVNGVVSDPLGVSTGSLDTNGSMKLVLGGQTGNTNYGYMDCFRLTKGHSRYQGAHFIPPIDGSFNSFDAGVTTTNLGTNTRQVSCYGGVYNHDAILASIDNAVIALGWVCYDAMYKYGTVTRVYRCLNKDANSYKYAILRFDKTRTRMWFNSCESWDISTKTATNECWNNYGAQGQMGFALQNCDIIIFGNARYLGFMTYIQGSPSQWSFCVENEREASEDTYTAGYPCWGMIHSCAFVADTYSNINNAIAMPRTRPGWTGQNAALSWTQNHSNFTFGQYGVNVKPPYWLVSTVFNSIQHGWDTAKRLITSVKHFQFPGTNGVAYQMYNYGRLFGVKVAPPLGNLMDKISLPVDADGFFAAGGTETDHWILPSHTVYASNHLIGVGGTGPTTQSWSVGSVSGWCVIFDGRYAWIAHASGLWKHDCQAGSGAAVAGVGGGVGVYDLATDGRWIWAAGQGGLYQIDTTNGDAVQSLSMGAGGLATVKWDGRNHIYVGQYNSATNPLVYKIDTTNFAAGSTLTITPPVTTSAYYLRSMCVDGNETLAWACGNATTATDSKYCFVSLPTGSAALSTVINGTHSVHDQRACNWSGTNWMFMNTVNAGTIQVFLTAGQTGTNVATQFSVTRAHTNIAQQKCFVDRVGTITYGWVPSSAAGAGACEVGNAAPDGATSYGTNMGTMTSQPRCAWHTGNSILAQGQDTILYQVTNLYQKAYNAIIQPQVLIPK